MNQDIELLAKTLQEVMPEVCKEWNNDNLGRFLYAYRNKPFKEIFKNRQTQEKTKAISPIIDEIVAEFIQEKIEAFTITEGKGFDYTLNNTEIEWKNSLSNSKSWTGNGYKKTNWHVLCKFVMNEDGKIEKYFACIVPYDNIKSNWSKPKNSNFSSLNLLISDYNDIIKVVGDLIPKKKYLEPQFVNNGSL